MLFSYFVSERAAREARRRARILAQRKRRTIIRYSLALFATLLLIIAASILFSRTSVHHEPSDEQVIAHDSSEDAHATDRQQTLEQPPAMGASDIQTSTHTAADSQPLAEPLTTQPRDEGIHQHVQSGSEQDDAITHTASAPSSTTSHRLASVSTENESSYEAVPASVQNKASSEKARLSQLSVRQQPLDTIGDEEGGKGIIITLDKKTSHAAASRKENVPYGSLTEHGQQAELKTDVKVSSVEGGILNSHTNSNGVTNATTNHKASLQLTSVDTNIEASQETQRTANAISTQHENPTLKAGDSLRWTQDASVGAVAASGR